MFTPTKRFPSQLPQISSLIKDKAFINGEWISAASGKTFEVRNPFNGDVIGSVPDMNEVDTQKAIKAAKDAFSSWKETTAKERSIILRRWYELCHKNINELGQTIVTIKPRKNQPILKYYFFLSLEI